MSNANNLTQSIFSFGKLIPLVIILLIPLWIGLRIFLPNLPTIFAGSQPENIGLKVDQLAPCPSSPNCVSSQSEDTEHYIEPLVLPDADNFAQLKELVQGQPGAQIIATTDNYLYAQFTSKWMGFVDDVEFYLNPQLENTVEVRSASRLGESDLGVNRQRIETIRQLLAG